MQKHLATSTNGMPMPPTETSPLPNRVRDIVDRDSHSMEASVGLSAPGPRGPIEFNAKRTISISKLEDDNHFESGDPDTEDKIGKKEEEKEEEEENHDDGTEESISESESEEQEPNEELDASEEEENTSILSRLSSSLFEIIRIQDDKVAEIVTRVLERPVHNKSENPGWIYIISPYDLPGIMKIGFTMKPPVMSRFRTYRKCYGDFEVIATRLVPYAVRVEQLLLTEFSNNRCKLKECCHNCKISHRDLLVIDKESLLRSLEKWRAFVESSPYSVSGVLTPDAKRRLPLPALSRYLERTKVTRKLSK
jgi:hypothetical protein